jgi:hypothetical protein
MDCAIERIVSAQPIDTSRKVPTSSIYIEFNGIHGSTAQMSVVVPSSFKIFCPWSAHHVIFGEEHLLFVTVLASTYYLICIPVQDLCPIPAAIY